MPTNKIITVIIGVVLGGVFGFALYKIVGCSTGQCPITSNPWVSVAYGMLLGLLISLGIKK
jgi:hypothetical protein